MPDMPLGLCWGEKRLTAVALDGRLVTFAPQAGQLGEPTIVQGTSGGATSPAARRFVFRALLFTVR